MNDTGGEPGLAYLLISQRKKIVPFFANTNAMFHEKRPYITGFYLTDVKNDLVLACYSYISPIGRVSV